MERHHNPDKTLRKIQKYLEAGARQMENIEPAVVGKMFRKENKKMKEKEMKANRPQVDEKLAARIKELAESQRKWDKKIPQKAIDLILAGDFVCKDKPQTWGGQDVFVNPEPSVHWGWDSPKGEFHLYALFGGAGAHLIDITLRNGTENDIL